MTSRNNVLLTLCLFTTAAALAPELANAAPSIAGHQAQAAACRTAFARACSGSVRAKTDAATREEECLVQATDAVLPLIERAAGEEADVPNTVQTYRDAFAAFCGVIADNGSNPAEGETTGARAQCVATRESELARLVDEYAPGGRPPSSVTTGIATCDDAFKASHGNANAAGWTLLATCTLEHVKTKAAAFVPKVADGDPLGTLGHSHEQIAIMLSTGATAGGAVCDVLTQAEPMRARCHAEIAANIAKAVADVVR